MRANCLKSIARQQTVSSLYEKLYEDNATGKVNETDMRLWARQYAGQIRVTAPKELSERCREDILKALALYDSKEQK